MKGVDSALLTVTVYSRREVAVVDGIESRGADADGNYRYRLAHGRIESADSEERQRQLSELLLSAEAKLLNYFSDDAQALQGVDIHLTLLPRSGQAGLVLPAELFLDWAVWDPSVYVDAMR